MNDVRRLAPAALALTLALGCASFDEASFDERHEAIVNGTLGGDSAVVVLYNQSSGGLCTGALIAPRVVLTAKHCVQEAFAAGPVGPSSIIVGVGDDVNRASQYLRVQSIATTPGAYTVDARGSLGPELPGVDVAVMILQTGAVDVEPLPLRRETHTTLGGQTITAIGFGQTPGGGAGVKYTTTGRVLGTTPNPPLIYVGSITCQGDSGGPAITADGEIAGVVSFGNGSCGTGQGAYNAIFPFFDMIDAALTEAGACLNDGEERCDGEDNDCDDLIDETCNALGEGCAADSECVGLTCRETVAGQICTATCDPLRPDVGCDEGLYCARTSGCDGYCLPLGTGERNLLLGSPCADDSQCTSLFCTDPGDGNRRCLQACRGDSGMCLAGDACAANPGECGGCVAAEILLADRGIGEECTSSMECRSGACFEDAGRRYCSRACGGDSDCPDNFHCRGEACVAGPRGNIGDPCVANGDCGDGTFCATQGARSWCTRMCGAEECPGGFACVDAGGTMVCAPELGLVGDPCVSDTGCVSGICAARDGLGSCTRQCSPDVACAPGFECRRTSDGVTAVCVRPATEAEDGGCAVSPGRPNGGGAALVLGGLLLGLVLRRRP